MRNNNKSAIRSNNKNVIIENEWDAAIREAEAQLEEIRFRKVRLKAAIKASQENKRKGVSFLKANKSETAETGKKSVPA